MSNNPTLKKSIKTKVIIKVSALVALILTIAISAIVSLSITNLQEKTRLDLKNKIEHLTHAIELRLEYLQERTEFLASNELIVNAFLDQEDRDKYLLPLINNFTKNKYITNLSVLDFDGRVIFKTDDDALKFSDSKELRLSLSLGQTVTYFTNKESEIVFIAPIKYYGTTQGAIVATYNMKKTVERYNQLEDFIYTRFFKNEVAYYTKNYEDDKNYYRYQLLDNKSYTILNNLNINAEIGILQSQYLQPLEKLIVILFFFALFILAIGVIMSYYLATTITNPILALYNRVSIPSAKDEINAYELLESEDELEELGYAFYKKEKELFELNKSLDKKVEEAIKDLENAQTLAKIGSWEYDLVEDSFTGSTELYKIHGFTDFTMKLQKDTLHNTFHPDDMEMAQQAFIDSMASKEITIAQNRMIRQNDGEIRYLEHRWRTEYVDDVVVRTVGTTQDITERKEIEKSLEVERYRLEMAEKIANLGSWEQNFVHDTLEWSDEVHRIFEIDIATEMTFDDFIERVHPEDRDSVSQAFQASVQDHLPYHLIHRLLFSDGRIKHVLEDAQHFYDSHDTHLYTIGTVQDITKQKEADDSLKKANNLLRKLSDTIPVAIYQYKLYPDGNFSFPYVSIGIEDIFEITPKHIMNNAQILFDAIHPDDIEMVAYSIAKSAETMTLWTLECRVQLPKKGLRWLKGTSKPERLEDGSILWHGFIEDITNRKNIEFELEEQHKYLQSIIDGIDDPIMVIKEDYTIELMNSKLKESLDTTKLADPKNPKCYEVSHHRSTPCDGFEHPCPLRDVLETKQHSTVVHNHDTLDGEDRYIELSASPLFDKEKNCIGIIESARDITAHLSVQYELREQKSILDHQAHHDALTGLPNRVLFNDRLEQAIQTAKRNQTKIAVLFIDLDHFKEINDSLGHAVGDEILKTVSTRLQEVVRDEDTIARLGGDEFTIILEDLSLAQNASLISDKLLQILAKSMNVEDNVLYVSSSIGISIYPDDGMSPQNLLKFADSAMYKAKDEGRNNYQYYNSTMTELAFERVVMETSLRDALKNEEFVVHYQPQVDGRTNTLIGMEALVRWQHPSMGLVSPAKFIPLAETTGLIVELDRFVMKTAMKQISKWYEDGLNPGVLAMNLAVKQLKQTDFIDMFENLMQETKCKAAWLELEVTEGQIMTNPDEAIELLARISNLGIELAVDDFGTGYSSLAYLKRLPIDKLKIDQAFVRDLPDDEEDSGITKAVIALANSLNLRVIAEGVETKEQKDFLVENGCHNIQGYLYSKPIPADEFESIFL